MKKEVCDFSRVFINREFILFDKNFMCIISFVKCKLLWFFKNKNPKVVCIV